MASTESKLTVCLTRETRLQIEYLRSHFRCSKSDVIFKAINTMYQSVRLQIPQSKFYELENELLKDNK